MTQNKPVTTDDKWLTIGEAAEHTGVNPVTLRAWQRRFGLVMPKRTAKGHRLYSQAHLTQIKEILHWLNKGVAISKVKPLLKMSVVKVATEPLAKNGVLSAAEVGFWQDNTLFLNQCCIDFNAKALHDKLNELNALYPFAILKACLYWPWLSGHEATMGQRIDAAIIQAWLNFELTGLFSAKRLALLQEGCEPTVLLVCIGCEPHWSPLLFSAELSAYSINHQQINITNINQLEFIAQRLSWERILLIAHPQFNNADTRELERLIDTHQQGMSKASINLVGIYAKSVNQSLGLSDISIADIVDTKIVDKTLLNKILKP